MRGHPRAPGLEQRQQRPLCEEKMGPRPAREGTLELRPGNRAEAGVGELCPPHRRAKTPHFRGGVGLIVSAPLLETRADMCKRALVGRGSAPWPGQYFGTWEPGLCCSLPANSQSAN